MSGQDMKFDSEIFRKDHPMILASNRHHATIFPIRVKYSASDIVAGTVMAYQTSGAASGQYTAYDDSGASGLNSAACVLFKTVATESFADASDSQMGLGIFKGELFQAKLTGLDANGITDLKARSVTGADGAVVLIF